MADITKVVKYLIVGDASGASKTLKSLSGDMKQTAKSGSTGFRGLSKDLANARRDGKSVGSVLKNAASEAGGMGAIAGKVGIGLAATGAAAVAAGAAIAVKFGADSVDTFKRVAGEVAGLKRVTGMTTEDASRLGFSLKQSGVDAATGSRSMTIFSKNIAKMAETDKAGKVAAAAKADAIRDQIAALKAAGPSSANYSTRMENLKDKLALATSASKLNASALGDLGVQYTDSHGKMLPMSKLLPAVAEKFATMPDGAEKTALAIKLFGKSGTAMLPFLNKGAKGLAELSKKSDEFGNTLTDKQLQALKDSKQAQRDWDAAMQGLQVTLGSSLLPLLTKGAQFLNSVFVPAIQGVTEWIAKNQDGFEAMGNMMKWVWNNIMVPLIKLAITGFIQMNKPIAQAVQALGMLTGNKDMENFGAMLVSAADDAQRFADELKGIPDEVTPRVKMTDAATPKVKKIDKTIKSLKDKIVTAKAKGDDAELRTLQAKLAKAEKRKYKLSAEVSLKAGGNTTMHIKTTGAGTVKLGYSRGGINRYANGGIENHGAKIYRPWHGTRVFNEPETGGESYIPLSRSKRRHSLAIWAQTGRELGVFANGGVMAAGGSAGSLGAVRAASVASVSADDIGRAVAKYLNGMPIRLNGVSVVGDYVAGQIVLAMERG